MNKSFHNFLMGVSVLPALAIMPAVATEVGLPLNVGSDETVTVSGQSLLNSADLAENDWANIENAGTLILDGVTLSGNTGQWGVIDSWGDMTVTNSNINNNTAQCGILYNESGATARIENTNFINNTADAAAGIYSDSSDLIIVGGLFSGNVATTTYGAGVIGIAGTGSVNVTGARFESNMATTDYSDGGAILQYDGSSATIEITNSEFVGNKADNAGGAITSDSVLRIANSKFIGNKMIGTEMGTTLDDATEGGGAIFLYDQSQTTITGSTFSNNESGTWGGAIATRGIRDTGTAGATSTLSINKSTFTGNSAVVGGAIANSLGSAEITGSTFDGNIATTNGGAVYNKGTLILSGTNTFTGNMANGLANDIHNIGSLTVASGTTTMDGGITGDGTLSIASGATLNIKTAAVTQGTISLNGTMVATVREGDAQITAGTFDGDGTLSLVFNNEGTYHVFGDKVFANAKDQVSSSIYDITWANEDKDITATLKSAAAIAEENNLSENSATAILGMSQSSSEKLNEVAEKIQEKLAESTPEAQQEVEKAAKAVHPETESVTQSVATAVQTTVNNLASARMAAPRFGRNGGDVRLTSGGVWAQGLFNKSKQNDAFHGYTRGVAAGMDGTINKVWTVGAGYSYAHSDISGSARDTEIDSNTIFVYGQYKPAAWYLNAVLNYTMSDFSEEGIAMGTPVTADYDVDSFGGSVATGYDFATGITPELGLRYMHVNADDYTNSLGVKTKAKDADFLTGVLGAKYAFNINMDRYTKIIPQLNAAVKYDMLSDRNMATVTMPGVDAYTLRGERLNRLGGEFGIGLGLKYKSVDFSINYDIDVRKDYTSQTGMLKFRYNF